MASSLLHISLPAPLKAYVDAQVESGDYGTPSDFLGELIQNDRNQQLGQLEEQLVTALQEEPFDISPEEIAQGNLISVFRKRLDERK